MGSEVKLVERDLVVFREIDRWRVCLGRHLKELAGFEGQRACDRRLRKLIDTGYIERKKVLYGVPGIYRNTNQVKLVADIIGGVQKIRVEQVKHDIAVLDIAIFVQKKASIPFVDMITEKQLHSMDGFGKRKHRPDFIYPKNRQMYCVEVEFSLKSKDRFEDNMKQNFLEYDRQIWVVPDIEYRIIHTLEENQARYPNIHILKLSEVQNNEFFYRSCLESVQTNTTTQLW